MKVDFLNRSEFLPVHLLGPTILGTLKENRFINFCVGLIWVYTTITIKYEQTDIFKASFLIS